MKVLVTGATGLLGGAVLSRLLSGGDEVRVLVRPESQNVGRVSGLPVELVYGDVGSRGDVARAASGAGAVVHIAGIEYAEAVVAGVHRAGVSRLVAVSSTSAHSRYPSRSGPKLAMERVVKESGLAWSVVRPAMIFGSELDKNIRHLLRFIDRSPAFPVFGDGTNLWQPVYYEDCADGTVAALRREEVSVGKIYDLPGASPVAYRNLVRTAAAALDKNPRFVNIPLEPVRVGLSVLEKLPVPLPFGAEQVERMREDKAYPFDDAARDLGYSPRGFADGVALEVARLRGLGMLSR